MKNKVKSQSTYEIFYLSIIKKPWAFKLEQHENAKKTTLNTCFDFVESKSKYFQHLFAQKIIFAFFL